MLQRKFHRRRKPNELISNNTLVYAIVLEKCEFSHARAMFLIPSYKLHVSVGFNNAVRVDEAPSAWAPAGLGSDAAAFIRRLLILAFRLAGSLFRLSESVNTLLNLIKT
eukprot:6459354-Amphidinium_carterae.1